MVLKWRRNVGQAACGAPLARGILRLPPTGVWAAAHGWRAQSCGRCHHRRGRRGARQHAAVVRQCTPYGMGGGQRFQSPTCMMPSRAGTHSTHCSTGVAAHVNESRIRSVIRRHTLCVVLHTNSIECCVRGAAANELLFGVFSARPSVESGMGCPRPDVPLRTTNAGKGPNKMPWLAPRAHRAPVPYPPQRPFLTWHAQSVITCHRPRPVAPNRWGRVR